MIEDSLGDRLRTHQGKLLEVLHTKLARAIFELDRVTIVDEHGGPMRDNGKIGFKRVKFVLFLKDSLTKTVRDLEGWRDRFDPSWWLILRLKNPSIETQLGSLESNRDKSGSLTILKNLKSKLSTERGTKVPSFEFMDEDAIFEVSDDITTSRPRLAFIKTSGRDVIIDTAKCDPAIEPGVIMKDVQDLARILTNADPSRFGLLSCHGVVKYQNPGENPSAYGLLLNPPGEVIALQSLRDFLEENPSEISLNERIDVALNLARAVLYLHAFHFVHKSIRPENVILFRNGNSGLGTPYLVGFEKFRLDTTSTHRYGDDLWEKNLYRHPHRQGIRPQEDFIMQHDVYSLGVVLLELGMNLTFVTWPDGRKERPVPAPELDISALIDPKRPSFGKANAIKQRLVALTQKKLPNTFGQKYSEVVLSCLTCLDQGNLSFGDASQFEEDDGTLVGVRYIEKESPDASNASYSKLTTHAGLIVAS